MSFMSLVGVPVTLAASCIVAKLKILLRLPVRNQRESCATSISLVALPCQSPLSTAWTSSWFPDALCPYLSWVLLSKLFDCSTMGFAFVPHPMTGENSPSLRPMYQSCCFFGLSILHSDIVFQNVTFFRKDQGSCSDDAAVAVQLKSSFWRTG